MPSYKNIIIFSFLIFFIVSCSNSLEPQLANQNLVKKEFKYKAFEHEDKYIMFALEFDRQGNKAESRELYKRLFEKTSNDEYLNEYLKLSFQLKDFDAVIRSFKKNSEKIEDKKIEIKKIYILSLIQIDNLDKALQEAKELLKLENSKSNNELLANIYLQKSEYKKVKVLYENLYKKDLDENILVRLSDIMTIYLGEKKEAINLLESHITMSNCSRIVCFKLFTFYQEDNNVDGIVSILKRMYFKEQKNNEHLANQRFYKLLMFYLEKQGVKEVMSFLEETQSDDNRLLGLYRDNKDYEKAYNLANKLYEDTSNIDYLAQIAIIEFEMNENKKDILESVIEKFEYVLTILDNHVYQNYVGYILIDFDIDVKKGLFYVKKALKKEPNNLAYLDSLAWGQYKLNDCKNAYINMKIVVDQAGLEEKEIIEHWEKIKGCKSDIR